MKLIKIAILADDMAKVYDGLKNALKLLEQDNIGKTKSEIKKALKGLEEIRPHLKKKDQPPWSMRNKI